MAKGGAQELVTYTIQGEDKGRIQPWSERAHEGELLIYKGGTLVWRSDDAIRKTKRWY